MTKLTRFLFGVEKGKKITTRPNGDDYWYMAADICRLLDKEGQHSQLVKKHLLASEWCHQTIHLGGYGKKRVLLVNTSGMLKLIMRGQSTYALEVQARIAHVPTNLGVSV